MKILRASILLSRPLIEPVFRSRQLATSARQRFFRKPSFARLKSILLCSFTSACLYHMGLRKVHADESRRIIEQLSVAVSASMTDKDDEEQSMVGNGFLYDDKGHIVTCHHIVQNASKVEIWYRKKPYLASWVGSDPEMDMAIYRIDPRVLEPGLRFKDLHFRQTRGLPHCSYFDTFHFQKPSFTLKEKLELVGTGCKKDHCFLCFESDRIQLCHGKISGRNGVSGSVVVQSNHKDHRVSGMYTGLLYPALKGTPIFIPFHAIYLPADRIHETAERLIAGSSFPFWTCMKKMIPPK